MIAKGKRPFRDTPTRRVLERMPEGRNDWKPHKKSVPLMAHHRGQLTVYLRLNDALAPSIYGPSADKRLPG